ncbi:hypothetical protein CC2G_011298 [Coprinopsis cinerea AmutBmut pab1-1]|nr:hypothetical protein CC2G_011298 [Coprinopsis cinerea AmutBmut pab1-1]
MSSSPAPQSPPERVSQRALADDPNNGRCLIQNNVDNCPDPVLPCYVVPKETEKDHRQMTAIEYNLKYQHLTLNLDTRRNVFFVSAELRELFIAGKWGLLPEKSILDRYHDDYGIALPRRGFPKFEEKVFKYTIIPLTPVDEQFPIPSILRYPNPSSSSSESTPTAYTFPFTDFPIVTSHIHPNFAVLHLGRHITKLHFRRTKNALAQKYPVIQQLFLLYTLWVLYPEEVSRDRGFRFRSPRSLRKQQEQQSRDEGNERRQNDAREPEGQLSDAETEPYRVYHLPPPKRASAKVSPSEAGRRGSGNSIWTKGEVCNWRRDVPQGVEPEVGRCNPEKVAEDPE